MRDPKRIDDFCNKLARLWHNVPDWRFGQFICNVMGDVQDKHGDIFFPEEDRMYSYMVEAMKNMGINIEEFENESEIE